MKEFNYQLKHFNLIQKQVKELAGINLSNEKQNMVYARLTKRLRRLDLDNFDHYCELIQRDKKELVDMIDEITTNVTHFFRENHHFEFLSNHVIPELVADGQKKINIWSAGCSSGQEPYSIAMTLLASAEAEQLNKRIVATDLSHSVLNHAINGIYDLGLSEQIPPAYLKRWFLKSSPSNSMKVKDELKKIIEFSLLNLMQEWHHQTKYDVIFCRNVMIYFTEDTQNTLIERYAKQLNPGGYLFVGHSENISRYGHGFEAIGKSMYRWID